MSPKRIAQRAMALFRDSEPFRRARREHPTEAPIWHMTPEEIRDDIKHCEQRLLLWYLAIAALLLFLYFLCALFR